MALINPPITTVASGRWTSAPSPLLKAIGKKPNDATNAVIKTGRSLLILPFTTTCCKLFSPFLRIRLNSANNTIPLSTATPNKAINPTPALMLKGIPRAARKSIPPIAESGIAV